MRPIAWPTVVLIACVILALVVLVALKPDPMTIAAVGGIGTLIAGVLDRAFGKPPPAASILLLIGALAAGYGEIACQDARDAGTYVEAGAPVVQKGCDFLEGVDDSGVLRNICATAEELISVAEWLIGLRATHDADAQLAACEPLPHTTFCATSAERSKAVLFIVRVRAARLTLDGGR